MISRLSLLVALLFCLPGSFLAQETPCPDPVPQTAGQHKFRYPGESFNIPIVVAGCQALALDLRWSNGANNGSNFVISFLDDQGQPVYSKQVFGFRTGNDHFPLTSFEWLGRAAMVGVPVAVRIQAVEPFRYPSSIFYRVTRVSRNPQRRIPGFDSGLALSLRTAAGKSLTEGQLSNTVSYRLDEVALDESRELEFNGQKRVVERAYRLMLRGGDLSNAALLWIDDAALPIFKGSDPESIVTLIYDAGILRDGAQISVSENDASRMQTLGGSLKLPAGFMARSVSSVEEGNTLVEIKTGQRLIGATRQPLVQIQLKTNRPFPARQSPLQLQVGRQFFLEELTGDLTGRSLTLTVTPEVFAALKDGAEIVAFFDRPDRSGAAGLDVWYFGRLQKNQFARQ